MTRKRSKGPSQVDHIELYVENPFPGLPELFMLGYDRFHNAKELPIHSHSGLMEITYVAEGNLVWKVGQQQYEMRGGHVFATWPNEVHGGIDGVWHPCEMYWVCIRLPKRAPAGYLGLPTDEVRALVKSLWDLPRRLFTVPPTIADLFEQIIQARLERGPLALLSARSALARLLISVGRHGQNTTEREGYSTPVAAAMEIMSEHLSNPYPIPGIAERVGLSVSHFHRCFKGETGLSPGDYYIRKRVDAARRLVEQTDLPLVEIALRCGFGSSQYLATCFRRVTGRNPSSYRGASVDDE